MSVASEAQQTPTPDKTPNRGSAATPASGAGASRGQVQLKRALTGQGFEAQAAMLSPDAAVQHKGGDGNSTDHVHAAAAAGIAGGGGRMPHADKIQASFGGHDVSGVKGHTGSEASKASDAMGAQAFATGDHVAFKGAPDLHTAAHEAAHVIQQKSGVSLSGGVGQSGDRYEQHADQVADAVVAGKSAAPILDKMAGGSGGKAGGGVQQRAVQRDATSTKPGATAGEVNGTANQRGATVKQVDDGGTEKTVLTGGSMAKDSGFETRAIAFENALGRDAASRGLGPATALANRCKQYIEAKVGPWRADNSKLSTELTKIGGDPSWTGAVGTEVNRLMSVFDSGNLRMKMFHIGNFYSNILQPDLLNERLETCQQWAEQAHIDVESLHQRLETQKSQGQKPNLNQTPAGSEVSGQIGARVRESLATGSTDTNLGATGQSLERQGLGLHPSEAGAQAEALNTQPGNLQNQVLKFNTGAKVWAVNEQNRWVQMMRELSLPLEAGPSGTTNWLMNAAKDIGGVSMTDARLACIGHLLPYRHHSLVEIMAAAEPHGCPFTAGQGMYRNILPYSPGELRNFGGGKFPDENVG